MCIVFLTYCQICSTPALAKPFDFLEQSGVFLYSTKLPIKGDNMKVTRNIALIIAISTVLIVSSSCSKTKTPEGFTQEGLAFMSATEQVELFKKGALSPVDVLNAQIEQYKKTNKEVNAVTYTFFDEGLRRAKESERRYKKGNPRPLEGITVGLKDEHYDEGWKVSQGSLVHKDDDAMDHADPITQKLKDAGAIPLLQTTVPELYLHFVTATKAWGVTRNPWNLKYAVGGSSGGSGAALAAGYVTIATGSDMGGSIRIPCAFDGLYGYKPAFNEVYTDLPMSHFSGTGPMARTFEDMTMMQNIISGPTKYSVNVVPSEKLPLKYDPIKGMKIAYVGGMGIIEPSKDTKAAMDDAIKALQSQGAVVDRVDLDLGLTAKDISELFSKMALSGAMGGVFAGYADKTDQMNDYAVYFVKKTTQGNYGKEQLYEAETQIKKMYKAIVDKVYANGYDVMILPTMPTSHVAADYDFSKDTVVDDGIEYPKLVGGLYTVPFNMLNWMPVISVPAGLSSQHMPIGMQIVGQPGHTEKAFKAAYNYSLAGPKFYQGNLMPEVK